MKKDFHSLVSVSGVLYNIYFIDQKQIPCPDDDEWLFGFTDPMSEMIYINKNMSIHKIKQYLIHELTHAYFYESISQGTDKTYNEEDICIVMALYGEIIIDQANRIMVDMETSIEDEKED